MKHIKKFNTMLNEDFSDREKQLYYINDYVKLKAEGFVDNKPRYFKITEVDLPEFNEFNKFNKHVFYFCIDPNNVTIWSTNDRIERKLNKYEVEKYEMDLISNKFNI